ncbi:MAG TPA: cytochrome P450 [Acidimicrobiales bacterium]|nr:cytochrome P450 [Acidimicrobiales bacterium]
MTATDLDTTADDDYDPFDAFNRKHGAGVVENPYPDFVAMRRDTPVAELDLREMFGLADDEMPENAVWTVNTFDTVQAVLRDGEAFSSKGYEEVMGAVFGHSILEMDEPEHHTYRGLIQQAFTRKAMERWERDVIEPAVHSLIDEFVDEGRADLVKDLTFPFPFEVIADQLCLPEDDKPRFHRMATELISVNIDMERALGASAALYEYFSKIIAERRKAPDQDLISVLARAELDGQQLTDDEIIAFLRLLLSAGAETTYRSSSNLLYGLLTHPDQLEAVRDDRSLLPQAIEEGLRWEPPLLTIMRSPTRTVQLADKELHAGDTIVINIGSANHDESRWENADEFDIFRPQIPHIAFASGVHMCLGIHLARMETTVVMNAVLDRLPELRLDPDAEAPYITGMVFRAPPALPVVFG